MKCIKPSGPYIAFLFLVLVVSFVAAPSNDLNSDSTLTNETLLTNVQEEGLEQIENISMLNTHEHE